MVTKGLLMRRENQGMKKIARLIIPLIFLGLLSGGVPLTPAQNMRHTVVERRVRFPRGRSKATVHGKARYGMSYVYLVRAKAGQSMGLRLNSRGRAATFSLFSPGEAHGDPKAFAVSQWSGALPQSGDYTIVVVMNERGLSNVRYTLEVTVN